MTNHTDAHDLGFTHDLPLMLGRRRLLGILGGLGLLSASGAPAYALECIALPWETQGPYPADGSNAVDGQTLNVLTQEGVIREDLRPSFGSLTRIADGLQLDLELTLLSADGCTPLAGAAIYLWHCDTLGEYSLYNVKDANYLRGVGIADEAGVVRFTTIFPGCYDGRWPHIHFEIFESIEAAVAGEASVLTAQIAMPKADCTTVYTADSRYTDSLENLGRISIATDNVFSDNSAGEIAQQTPSLTGDTQGGYLGKLTIPVDFTAERSANMAPPPDGGGSNPPPGK